MKFGFRKPSLRRRVAARTSLKRFVRHSLGLKAPRGWGWLTNPKRALYNRVYYRTTFGIGDLFRTSRRRSRPAKSAGGCGVVALIVLLSCGGLFSVVTSRPMSPPRTSLPDSARSQRAPKAQLGSTESPAELPRKADSSKLAEEPQAKPTVSAGVAPDAGGSEASDAPFRSWTDVTGQFTTYALLVSVTGSDVTLLQDNGKTVRVVGSQLSTADQAYLTNLMTPRVAMREAFANVIVGRTVGVEDGDTLTVLDATNRSHRIRLHGIDAPEGHQAFGSQSKQALSEKVFGRWVVVQWNELDQYQRTLGHVILADRYINHELVEEGWAWHYRRYSASEELANAQIHARSHGRGLWADSAPIAPWDFRRGVTSASEQPTATQPTSQRPSTEIMTVYVTSTGEKYHRAGCQHLRKSQIPISLDDARTRYAPCSVCRPPR